MAGIIEFPLGPATFALKQTQTKIGVVGSMGFLTTEFPRKTGAFNHRKTFNTIAPVFWGFLGGSMILWDGKQAKIHRADEYPYTFRRLATRACSKSALLVFIGASLILLGALLAALVFHLIDGSESGGQTEETKVPGGMTEL